MFWNEYVLSHYNHTGFYSAQRVLDLGCGSGDQLDIIQKRGCRAIGVDPLFAALQICHRKNLPIVQARAEALPFRDKSFDGILCKGVLPFTNEQLALEEISRILCNKAEVDLTSLGSGYYLRYLVGGPSLKSRFYGFRTLINTWIYISIGHRLPGFLGDTIYQSRRRLQQRYDQVGLELIGAEPSPQFMRLPVFIYQRLRRSEASEQR